MSFDAVILAAGKGTRMKDSLAKPLHKIAGHTMLEYVLDAVNGLNPNNVIVVQNTENDFSSFGVETVVQTQQLGSGDALKVALPKVTADHILVLNADMPLVTSQLLEKVINQDSALVTARLDNPFGYGRVFENHAGTVSKIVEQKDASVSELENNLVNAGIYYFKTDVIKEKLSALTNDNNQGEYYLTDATDNLKVVIADDSNDILGANDKVQLANLSAIMRKRINEKHMRNGVTIIDPATTYIDYNVEIGAETEIKPNTVIEGPSIIGEKNQIGPNAHLRPQTKTEKNVLIGNFVETKNAEIGAYTHVGHLSYVGDAILGEAVNIGAGTIFVNYDGKNKHISTVGDHSFIGSNSKIVAPVKIGEEAITAAGSTITDDIPKHAMGIARSRQTNKEDFWKKMEHEDFSKHD
jgi:bifunctional UDP-N-acetylglucosamine pyrophosphorylase/glucosamine-1-phosphate N-acetyltransferase